MSNTNAHIMAAIAATPWAVTPEYMNTILSIAQRENESPEAVAAKLGRPLMNSRETEMRGNVAVIPVLGPIFRYANIFTQVSQATSLDVLAKDFKTAQDDPNINHIVLNFDSPGGQASGIAEFSEMVRASNKPVTAYIDGMGASAAYWIASATSEIVISKTASVGSVGAVIGIDTRKPDGMIEIVSSQSPNKRPDVTTDEGRKQVQARIDALAQVFIDDIAIYRGVSASIVKDKFGQGDLRMGLEAVQLGMADKVSTFEDLIAKLTGNTTTKRLPTMIENQSSSIAPGDFEALAGKSPEAAEKIANHWWDESRALRTEFGAKSTLIAYAKAAAQNVQLGQKVARVHNSYTATKSTPTDSIDFESLKGMSSSEANQQAETWWRTQTNLQNEFVSEANFKAYCRAVTQSRIRVQSKMERDNV